jgi:hypothetical protein
MNPFSLVSPVTAMTPSKKFKKDCPKCHGEGVWECDDLDASCSQWINCDCDKSTPAPPSKEV